MLQQKRTYANIDYFAQLQERYDDAERQLRIQQELLTNGRCAACNCQLSDLRAHLEHLEKHHGGGPPPLSLSVRSTESCSGASLSSTFLPCTSGPRPSHSNSHSTYDTSELPAMFDAPSSPSSSESSSHTSPVSPNLDCLSLNRVSDSGPFSRDVKANGLRDAGVLTTVCDNRNGVTGDRTLNETEYQGKGTREESTGSLLKAISQHCHSDNSAQDVPVGRQIGMLLNIPTFQHPGGLALSLYTAPTTNISPKGISPQECLPSLQSTSSSPFCTKKRQRCRPKTEKKFPCGKNGCTKSYRQPTGLKYHQEFGTCTFEPALTSLQWNLEEAKAAENGNSHSRKKRKSEAKESPNAPSSYRHNHQLSPTPTSFCRPATLNTAPTMDSDVMTSHPPYNQLVVQPSASPSTPYYPQTEFQSWMASLPPSTSCVYQRLQDVLNSQVLRPHTPHFPAEQATNQNTWTATPKSA